MSPFGSLRATRPTAPPGARVVAILLAFALGVVPTVGPTAVAGQAPSAPAQESAGADPAAADSATAEPGSELRVWLLTAGPGAAVWERFGHNAIRVLDTTTGRDVAYNWGIFDFDQVDFVPRFLKGQMLYMMAPFQAGPMVESYAVAGREIVAQELALTPAQRLELRDLADLNALPENREYFYDYFLDNCSTRARDLLDRVLGGALSSRFADAPTGTSFRYHIRRLTRTDPWLYTGMDVLLGTRGDRPISVWEEMFLPMTVRDAIRDVTVPGADGAPRPLVIAEEVLVPATLPEPTAPPTWIAAYLLLGLLLGAALAWTGARAAAGAAWGRYGFVALGTVWSLLAGFVGTLLVLVLFTDHHFMAWNENLFLFTPLSLALLGLVPVAARRPAARVAAERIALAVLAIAALGVVLQVLPGFRQQNAIFIALALPAHAGLWWALRGLGVRIARVSKPM